MPSLSTQHQFFHFVNFRMWFLEYFFYFKSTQETCTYVYYFPLISSMYLNALAMCIMYHQTDQSSFLYGLTRPSLGQCDFMRPLELILKKVSLSQLLFDRYIESENNKKKKSLLGHDDDGTNSRISIKNPDTTECLTQKCSISTCTLTIYNNNNNHSSKKIKK